MSKEKLLHSMVIVIGPCWTNFCSQKLKRSILATFSFNRTALCATQPKLHSMFCVLFLKIALSATELISFGHLGAATQNESLFGAEAEAKLDVLHPDFEDRRADGHLGAAIWQLWSIICMVPSKISVTPTSQRQLTL